MTTAGHVPIVLCSSREAERAVQAVADVLSRQGYVADRLLGVDADATMLTRAADRVRGAALFVLCWGGGFSATQARRLEGLFSARKGPQHRMISVELSGRGPTTVMPQILSALAELQRPGQFEEDDDGRYMRDVITPSSVSAIVGGPSPRGSSPIRSSAARTAHTRPEPAAYQVEEPSGISGEALGLEADKTVFDPTDHHAAASTPTRATEPDLPVRAPDMMISTDPTTGEITPQFPDEPLDGVPTAVVEDYPMSGAVDGDTEGRPAGGVTRPRRRESTGRVEMELMKARGGAPDPRAESDDRPLPSASTPIDVGLPDTAPDFVPPVAVVQTKTRRINPLRMLALLIAIVGMLGILAMAVLHDRDLPRGGTLTDVEVAERGLPGVDKRAADSAPTDNAAVGTPPDNDDAAAGGADEAADGDLAEPAADDAAPVDGASEGAETDGGATDASATAGDEAPPADAGDDDPAELPPSTTSPPAIVPPLPTEPTTANALDLAVEEAIADGRILAADELLALPAAATTMTWDEAASRCKRRKAEGLRRWRLPSKGELVKLRKAKLITYGTFWSRSVVGGDEVWAYDAGSGRMNMWLKIEPNARALCVRKRPQ